MHCWSLSSFTSLEEWAEVACVYLSVPVYGGLCSKIYILSIRENNA